jgi:hypothetical protein
VRDAGGLESLVARLCAHARPEARRVAEGNVCPVFPALLTRQRLVERLTVALAATMVARREGCRRGCASAGPSRRTVRPRSRCRTSAVTGGRTNGGTSLDRRERC